MTRDSEITIKPDFNNQNPKSEDIQILSAYIDDELPASERTALEQRLAEDEQLRMLLQILRHQDQMVRSVVDSIEEKPLKPALKQLLRTPQKSSATRFKRVTAFAVSLAAGLLVFAVFFNKPGEEQASELQKIARTGESLSAELGVLLATMVAGETRSLKRNPELAEHAGRVTELLAFTRKDGVLCKHYVEQQSHYAHEALACLENNKWIVKALAAMDPQATTTSDVYQPAGDNTSVIDAYIEEHIAGTALSAEQERKALQQR